MKKLVAYFSATGVTAGVAENLTDAVNADLFEICPKDRYTKEDLNWWEETSRSSLEMKDPEARPEIAGVREDMDRYDAIFVGFPIWWNVAPRIINTFLESYDFSGKVLIPFATSGGSGTEKVVESIRKSCPGARILEPRLLGGNASFKELSSWAERVLKDL